MDVAGFALTVLPLVLKGLQQINDASRKFWGYRRALGRIVRQLEVESLKLNNTCRNLLQGIATAEELQLLVEGKGWDEPALRIKLTGRLGAHGIDIFKRHMGELHSIFSELYKELDMTDDFKPALLDAKTKKRLLKKLKFVSREDEYKDLLARVYAINADLASLTMQQTRPTEVQLSQRTRTLPEAYNLIRQYTMKIHGLFQKNLHEASACTCVTAHNVNLRIQSIDGKQDSDIGAVRFKIIFSFDRKTAMISRVPWDWQESGFQPTEVAPATTASTSMTTILAPDPTTRRVQPGLTPQRKRDRFKDKFRKFATVFEPQGKSAAPKAPGESILKSQTNQPKARVPFRVKKTVSFGTTPNVSFIPPVPESGETTPPLPLDLENEIQNLCQAEDHFLRYSVGILEPGWGRWQFLQPSTVPSAISYMSETVSLQDLLCQGVLELRTRLELGVQLASAVVQFHGTEWLGESWGSEHIFFFVRQDVQRRAPDGSTWYRDPIIDKPFLRHAFGGANEAARPTQSCAENQVTDYDKSLFSLGIVLIELWHGRCFRDLRSSSGTNTTVGDHGHYIAACNMMGEMIASGESYLLAVMRCLGMSRPASTRPARRSLEDSAYKSEVHETVITVLAENYKIFANAVPDD